MSERYTAFHVKEDGGEQFFQLEGSEDAMEVAKFLRWQLRQTPGTACAGLAKAFPGLQSVTAEEYDQLTALRMETPRKVTGVFELDFDAKRLSVVDAEYGWQTWSMADVTAALETACRKSGLAPDQYELRFWQALEGRQLLTPGHLSAREIVLADEISDVDGLLDFYMEVNFDVDAVFGTYVCTPENDDWLNVYANYDMAAGEVCDELLLVLHRGDGSEEELTYSLDAVEKAVLLRKMDEHCQFQTGQTLEAFSAQLMEELAPPSGPTM